MYGMNANDLHNRAATNGTLPLDYATRRVASLLVVAGAFLALLGAVVGEAAGLPEAATVALIVVSLVGGVAAGTALGWHVRHAVSRRHLAPIALTGATRAPRRADVSWSIQLGPDREQTLGR